MVIFDGRERNSMDLEDIEERGCFESKYGDEGLLVTFFLRHFFLGKAKRFMRK